MPCFVCGFYLSAKCGIFVSRQNYVSQKRSAEDAADCGFLWEYFEGI